MNENDITRIVAAHASEFVAEINTLRRALDNACAFVARDRPQITEAEWLDYFILVAKEQMKLSEEE